MRKGKGESEEPKEEEGKKGPIRPVRINKQITVLCKLV